MYLTQKTQKAQKLFLSIYMDEIIESILLDD